MPNTFAARILLLSSSRLSRGLQRLAVSLVALSALLFSPFLQAAESDGYIATSAYYLFADEGRNVGDSNLGIQLNPGMRLHESWWLEGHLFGTNLDKGSQQTTDFYQYGLGGDIVYAFGDRDKFTPYVLAGAGRCWRCLQRCGAGCAG